MSKLAINEHWLVAVPSDSGYEFSLRNFNDKIGKIKPEAIYTFHMPYLSVSTLDSLVAALDEMTQLEMSSESVLNKLANALVEILTNERHGAEMLENSIVADGLAPKDYLIYFNWDVAKYPTRQSVINLSPLIRTQIGQIDQDLGVKMKTYSHVVASLSHSLKKRSGTFATKYLGDFVTRDDFILESEVLRTIVVAVPLGLKEIWWRKYEHLDDSVVPRSSRLINEDDEFSLFTVTLLKVNAPNFAVNAKKNGFLARIDFDYDETEICEFNRSWQLLHRERIKLFDPLLKWLRMSFSEAFITYVHVKATKVFVESVIRYGLPENVSDILVQLVIIDRRRTKNMKDLLRKIYSEFDPAKDSKKKRTPAEAGADKEEYFPVVLSRIRVHFSEILNL